MNFKGEIFCIGGWNQTHGTLNSVEVFDANTEEWKTSDLKLGIGRIHHKAVAHTQFIYVLGGISESGRTDSVERIDVSTGKVEILNVKLNHERHSFAVAKVKLDVYIGSGYYSDWFWLENEFYGYFRY